MSFLLDNVRADDRISRPNKNASDTNDYGDHRGDEEDVGFVGLRAVDFPLTRASVIDFRESTAIRVLCVWRRPLPHQRVVS
jgi:hypothetical protein